jgi:hypothetical protein
MRAKFEVPREAPQPVVPPCQNKELLAHQQYTQIAVSRGPIDLIAADAGPKAQILAWRRP